VWILSPKSISGLLVPEGTDACAAGSIVCQLTQTYDYHGDTIQCDAPTDNGHYQPGMEDVVSGIRADEHGDKPKLKDAENETIEAVVTSNDVEHVQAA
jgi:acetylornithine/succinyldiaminopimelate/putrescine aminotransferase